MKYGEFKQQFQAIKDGRASFAPVYIVSGDDEYLKDEVLALFKSAVDPNTPISIFQACRGTAV